MIMVLRLLRLESILLDLLLSREVVGLTLISKVHRDQVGAGTWCHGRTLSSADKERGVEGSGLLSCCVDRGETTLLESWLVVAVVITLQRDTREAAAGVKSDQFIDLMFTWNSGLLLLPLMYRSWELHIMPPDQKLGGKENMGRCDFFLAFS